MKITISEELKNILPEFNIISYKMEVDNKKTIEVKTLLENLTVPFSLDMVTTNPLIKETRDGYKKLKKDPSHTRCAAEALIRRVIKHQESQGTPIYSLGDIIDLGNILSVKCLRSVCVVDADKINGDILIRIGKNKEIVEAINRSNINAENLIVYVDALGIFGSPTSDTLRTSVTDTTKNIIIMIICFSQNNIKENESLLLNLYKTYANARNIEKI